jgi:divalent metal cation (Fe/Co/Zn/Cd) transporter
MPATSRDDIVRSALRVSAISACWTLVASIAAVVIGLSSNSLALVAFGVVGILDCAGSVALVAHFRDARSGGSAEHLERIALHVITAGLIAVGLATAAVSVMHLVDESTATSSTEGATLAAVSLVVLTLLSLRKRHVAARLPSHALRADSHLSAIGAVLAAVTLAGTVATSSLGWWWADPAAALVIAAVAVGLGITMRHEPETELQDSRGNAMPKT